MTGIVQKRLLIAGALVAAVAFLAANAHLVGVAFQTQPACIAVDGTALPAKRVC